MFAYDREALPLGEVLDRQVAVLHEAHRAGDPVAARLLRGTGTKGPARLAIALDHGYADWALPARTRISVPTPGSRRPLTRSARARLCALRIRPECG